MEEKVVKIENKLCKSTNKVVERGSHESKQNVQSSCSVKGRINITGM
jgi:hypothetical protein